MRVSYKAMYTHGYWSNAGHVDVRKVVKRICDGMKQPDQKGFQQKYIIGLKRQPA
jgi:hypothetical protein